jgi:16S rRNA processing protein RimM
MSTQDRSANADVVLGTITSVFGIKGWLRLRSNTEPLTNIANYAPWRLRRSANDRDPIVSVVEPTAIQPQGKGLVVKLKGIDDRSQAEPLVGHDIVITRDQLPELENDDYYWSDLIGLKVMMMDGQCIGVVKEMMETGSNDVLVVEASIDSIDDRERLVPFIRQQVVKDVNLAAGTLHVEWDLDF